MLCLALYKSTATVLIRKCTATVHIYFEESILNCLEYIGFAWRDVLSGPEWVSTETRGGGAGLETVSSPQETRHWSQERHSGLTINHRSHYTENYLNDTVQCRRLPWHPYIPRLQILRYDFLHLLYWELYSTYIPFHTLGRVRTASVFGLSPFTPQLFSYLLSYVC